MTSNPSPDAVEDRVSVGDVKKYEIDPAPWLVGKGTIESVLWHIESGFAAINDTGLSALITFNQSGRTLITITITTSTGEKKKLWLKVRSVDRNLYVDDYGMNHG